MAPSSAVIEDGRALWVLGGTTKELYPQLSTQIVRPGQPTVWGPNMTEETMDHCSATLANKTVMVTGGRRSGHVSPWTEVFSFTTHQWTRRADMNQRRSGHSCSTVWLDIQPATAAEYGIISQYVDDSSVLSVVVAGGDGGGPGTVHSVEVYIPWNNTWLPLPALPDLGDGAGRVDTTRVMSLDGSNLFLLGGGRTYLDTGLDTNTKTVWRLLWDGGSRNYSWASSGIATLGR